MESSHAEKRLDDEGWEESKERQEDPRIKLRLSVVELVLLCLDEIFS